MQFYYSRRESYLEGELLVIIRLDVGNRHEDLPHYYIAVGGLPPNNQVENIVIMGLTLVS